jgi:hypothetical protein
VVAAGAFALFASVAEVVLPAAEALEPLGGFSGEVALCGDPPVGLVVEPEGLELALVAGVVLLAEDGLAALWSAELVGAVALEALAVELGLVA